MLHVRDGGTETQGGNLLEVTRWPAVGWDSNAKRPPATASCPSLKGPHGPTEEFHTVTDVAMIPGLFFFLCLLFALWGQLVSKDSVSSPEESLWNIFMKGMGNGDWLLPSQDT